MCRQLASRIADDDNFPGLFLYYQGQEEPNILKQFLHTGKTEYRGMIPAHLPNLTVAAIQKS